MHMLRWLLLLYFVVTKGVTGNVGRETTSVATVGALNLPTVTCPPLIYSSNADTP
jgi:hypothetical protein